VEAQGAQGRKSLIAKQTDVLGNAELYSQTPHPALLEINNDKSAGILKKTLTSVTKSYQPKHTKQVPRKRLAPIAETMEDPPPITEDDIDKGMMNLLNKGIIPKDVDLTPAFEKGAAPVTVKSMKFHDKALKYERREI
jgi:hypothetical protein